MEYLAEAAERCEELSDDKGIGRHVDKLRMGSRAEPKGREEEKW
jgi:hypothetical protein